MNYSLEEIRNYVTHNLGYLNLTEKEVNKYVNFIMKTHNFAETHHLSSWTNSYNYFEQRFEDLTQLFLDRGYSEEESIELTKKIIIFSDRKELKDNLNFIRVLNCEKNAISSGTMFYRKKLEDSHARKKYLLEINDCKNQTVQSILKDNNARFEKRFNVSMPELRKKYPLTTEIKDIWEYLGNLPDEKLKEEFKITREQLAMIYPTTKEEVLTVKKIAYMSDEEIKETYGITREEVMQKYPLNNDTLKALRAIQNSKSTTVENIFKQPKEQVLHLRTITTEMINKANARFQLKKAYMQARIEKEKCIKKGTYPNNG